MTGCAAQTGVFRTCRRSHVLPAADGCALVRRATRQLGGVCRSSRWAPAQLWCAVFLLSPLSALVPSEKEAEVSWRALGRGDAGGKVKGKNMGQSLFELQPLASGELLVREAACRGHVYVASCVWLVLSRFRNWPSLWALHGQWH